MPVSARRRFVLGAVAACAVSALGALGLAAPAMADKVTADKVTADKVMADKALVTPERPLVDFNHDGFGDLVLGIPYWDGTSGGHTVHHAGRIQVVYGSASGFDAATARTFNRASSGIPGALADSLDWGRVITTGDFDDDGYTDVAVGDPTSSVTKGGNVTVLYGSASGLSGTGATLFSQSSSGVPGAAESGDGFGDVLHAGDVDGDGRDDLVVGVPFEHLGSASASDGTIDVLFGSSSGITGSGAQMFDRNSSGVPSAGGQDEWGRAFAVGDFDGDGRADLAVGEENRTVSGHAKSGLVDVLYGSSGGLSTSRLQRWSESSSGILGAAESGDEFGAQLTAGDFDGDGRADLAVVLGGEQVSVPWPTGGSRESTTGALSVLYGGASGLSASGNQVFTQNTSGLAVHHSPRTSGNTVTAFRSLAPTLIAGDLDNDGRSELAIRSSTGITVLPGTASGLSATHSALLDYPAYGSGTSAQHPYVRQLAILHPIGASALGVVAAADAEPQTSDSLPQNTVYLWTPSGALPTSLPADPNGQIDPGLTGAGTPGDNEQYGAGLTG